MEKRTLLHNISQTSLKLMGPCFNPTQRFFDAGETIVTYSSSMPKYIEFLESGSAKLQILTEEGNMLLLERYSKGDLFGELFSLPLDTFEYIVTAETPCSVLFIDYKHVIKPCENLCEHHSQLISNMFMMAAQKSQELSLHISILHQGTIRAKLLTYLRYISNGPAEKRPDGTFILPMSLAELSDYLSVDRSAMMRELKAMKADGLLESNRREFKLFN